MCIRDRSNIFSTKINLEDAEKSRHKIGFENLTPLFPTSRLTLEQGTGSAEDLSSRIIDFVEWKKIEDGIKQRLKALNLFIKDVYHEQFFLNDNMIPAELIVSNPNYLRIMRGLNVPKDIYTHISGIDLVRTSEKNFFVLEDNLRVPSGASYMIENRSTMMHMFPELFTIYNVKPVFNYPDLLLKSLIKKVLLPMRKGALT